MAIMELSRINNQTKINKEVIIKKLNLDKNIRNNNKNKKM